MYFPRCICFADALNALSSGQYRAACAIGVNVLRNRISAANSVRRSKWWLR